MKYWNLVPSKTMRSSRNRSLLLHGSFHQVFRQAPSHIYMLLHNITVASTTSLLLVKLALLRTERTVNTRCHRVSLWPIRNQSRSSRNWRCAVDSCRASRQAKYWQYNFSQFNCFKEKERGKMDIFPFRVYCN